MAEGADRIEPGTPLATNRAPPHRMKVPAMKKIALSMLAVAAALSLGACSTPKTGPDVAVVLFPGTGTTEQLQSGCWASFFDERNFNGSSLTLVGPVELTSFDKDSARQLRRDIRSVITGPRATLILYEKQFLSARSVGFQPGMRESGLIEKLGFGGRIESLQLRCS